MKRQQTRENCIARCFVICHRHRKLASSNPEQVDGQNMYLRMVTMKNAHKSLIGKTEKKGPLGRQSVDVGGGGDILKLI
jgi:hypothetical protein